jgi:flavin reductase (DIM6/NTAB) family NADH-FMN oxidoreductase RutF
MSEATSPKGSLQEVTGRVATTLTNPRLAILVTSCSRDGVPNVVTLGWHSFLSASPLMFGVGVGLTRYSHTLISSTGEFVVNLIDQSMKPAVLFCGTHSGRDCNKFAMANLKTEPAYTVRPPLLTDALAHLECRTVQHVLTGDHTFFIAKVLYAEVRSDIFSEKWDTDQAKLLYYLNAENFGGFQLEK